MIKFFRKIRRNMLTENKISRFLIYSIGEILLVVIGILLALQINNWNESKKSDQKQRNYLALIKSEMSNNLESLTHEQQRLNEALEGLREFITMRDQSSLEITEKEISSSWGKVFSKTIQIEYEDGALSELISSGILKEISSDTIRNILASWDGKIQKVRSQEKEVNVYLQKGNDYVENHGNLRTIIDNSGGNNWWGIDKLPNPFSNKFLLESQKFENIVVFAIGTGQALDNSFYEEIKNEMTSLTTMIDKELEK